MSSMRLEQGKPEKCQGKPEAAEDFVMHIDYPSSRYFQIHFQHLYEALNALQQQMHEANRQIAEQNRILRTAFKQTEGCEGGTSRKPAKTGRNSKALADTK